MARDDSARSWHSDGVMTEPAPSSNAVPRSAAVLGLVLAACAWLPLTPGGRSFFQVALETFGDGIMAGIVMVAGFGSPFIFGLMLAVGVGLGQPETAPRLLRTPVMMMHSQLLLVSWMIWREGDAIASLPLLLFAFGSGLYFVEHSARGRATGRTPTFAWYARWGALIVVAVAGWLWLQRMGGFAMGRAVDVAGLCALGLVMRIRPGQTATPPSS